MKISKSWFSGSAVVIAIVGSVGTVVPDRVHAGACAANEGTVELLESGTSWSVHAIGFKDVIPGAQFAVELALCDAPAGTEIIEASASMPAHGHGMNYQPEIHDNAHGDIVSSGWLMHMPGKWQVQVRTRKGSDYHTFTGDITVSP